MLDFSKLDTPASHGDVLVVPEARALARAAEHNNARLRTCDAALLDATVGEWRRRVREHLVGTDEKLVIITGHQPALIHAGVWAKHVAVARLAKALGGVAINLVVDSDAPHRLTLEVPSVRAGRVIPRSVPFIKLPAGHAFEQVPPHTRSQQRLFEQAMREAMGDLFDRSQMPVFFEAFAATGKARDWVEQVVAGRRAVEARLGVVVDDRRVSEVWCGPLLLDLLLNARRLRVAYNQALAHYRQAYKVRNRQRPIPDLVINGEACEVPAWVYRANEPRRRLFVERVGDAVRLFADQMQIGEAGTHELESGENVAMFLARFPEWRFRPRALTLTIWARLLLADLFIHGIGGAKYDRIADRIIADYYGLTPPRMACVSATLLLDLPGQDTPTESVSRARRSLRDLRYNPQRHLASDPSIEPMIKQRAAAVQRSIELRANQPRARAARGEAFDQIRAASGAMLRQQPEALTDREAELARALDDLQAGEAARNREYFFALHTTDALERLMDALPPTADFRV